MTEYRILKRVKLDPVRHRPTGGTRHFKGGILLPAPVELLIMEYPDDSGYYLLYLDESGNEMTDTFHETLTEAMEQATWEFQVKRDEWIDH